MNFKGFPDLTRLLILYGLSSKKIVDNKKSEDQESFEENSQENMQTENLIKTELISKNNSNNTSTMMNTNIKIDWMNYPYTQPTFGVDV